MEQHGKILANSHKLMTRRSKDRLLGRLAENQTVLFDVHTQLTDDVKRGRRISPAGEWLLDNFYVIEEQIRTAELHLPKGYSQELPCLAAGASAGFPRVYDLALESISHSDGQVAPESLKSIVVAYQSVVPLNLGELWAIPIMLRLALIENLRRVAVRIARHRADRNRARNLGRPDDRSCRQTAAGSDPDHCRHDSFQPALGEFIRGRTFAPSARQGTGTGPAVDLDRAAVVRKPA